MIKPQSHRCLLMQARYKPFRDSLWGHSASAFWFVWYFYRRILLENGRTSLFHLIHMFYRHTSSLTLENLLDFKCSATYRLQVLFEDSSTVKSKEVNRNHIVVLTSLALGAESHIMFTHHQGVDAPLFWFWCLASQENQKAFVRCMW